MHRDDIKRLYRFSPRDLNKEMNLYAGVVHPRIFGTKRYPLAYVRAVTYKEGRARAHYGIAEGAPYENWGV